MRPNIDTFIYVIINSAWPNHVKIGKSIDVKRRLKNYQTYSPYKDYKVYYSLMVGNNRDALEIERYFNDNYPNSLNEWYELDKDEAVRLIKKLKIN